MWLALLEEEKLTEEEQILKDYDRWLHIEASKLSSASYDIEDLVQEGRVAMWKALKTFDPARGKLPSWLTYKAKNRMLTCVTSNLWEGTQRKTGNHSLKVNPIPVSPELIPEMDFCKISDSSDFAYHGKQITDAVKRLTAKQQKYVYMRFWQGMVASEMVQEFGYNPNGLWASKDSGAKARLKETLAHLKETV